MSDTLGERYSLFFRYFCIGIVLTVLVHPAHAQRIFRGTVIDASTDETLPAVTLQILETGGGTITNAVGMYELDIFQLPATVVIRHIGYETKELYLSEETQSNLDILLNPVAYELEEVVVTDEDPAYNIMRKVIERKKQDRKHVKAYQAQTYSRFQLYSDFELAQMRETIANHYWLPEQGTRSLIRARRTKPTRSSRFRFASTQHVPDFYDDTIYLLGLELIGPTHPNALDVYNFTLGGLRSIDGKRVYDIYFGPHSGHDTALIGHVSVLDEEYVLLEVTARPSPDNVLPAPIKEWDAHYQQQFAPLGDSLWLPVDLRVEGSISFGRLGVAYPSAQYKQVSRLTRYAVNVPPPDSIFLYDDFVTFEPNVDRQDYLFRWNPGLVPMTPAEIEEVVEMDPRKGLNRHFRPIGVLANYTAIALQEESAETSPPEKPGLFESIFSGVQLDNNRVEGIYLGMKQKQSVGKNIDVFGYGGYGFKIDEPSYGGGLTYKWGLLNKPAFYPHRGFVRVGFDQRYAEQYTSRTYSSFANGAMTYVGWEDYFDYYEQNRRFVQAGITSDRLSTTLTAGFSRETHAGVETSVEEKGRFFGSRPRVNPEIRDGDYDLFSASVEVGSVPDVRMKAGGNGLKLGLTRNVNRFENSGISFTRYDATGSVTIPTLYRRRSWPNALHMRFYGATYKGDLPLQFTSVLDIARHPIAPFGAFKTLSGLPIKGANVWSVFWEHDFSTALFEYLGMWAVAKGGLGITVHGAHGQAFAGKGHKQIDAFSLYDESVHHELGLSLTQLFNLPLRFDVTRNLNTHRFHFGVGITKKL